MPRATHAAQSRALPRALKFVLPLAAVGALAIVGVVGASAATLAGVRTNDLGASTGTVASHSAGITVAWTPVFAAGSWQLNGLTLTAPAADRFTIGEVVRLTLIDSANVQVCQVTKSSATLSATLTVSRAEIDTACGAAGILISRIDSVAVSATR